MASEAKAGERWFWVGERSEFKDKFYEMLEWAGDLASFDIRLNEDTVTIVALYDNRAWSQIQEDAKRKQEQAYRGCDNLDKPCTGRCRCDGGFFDERFAAKRGKD